MKKNKFTKFFTIILAIFIIGGLTACATQPATTSQDEPVIQEEEVEAPQAEEAEESGPVTVTIATPIDPESLDPAFDTSIKAISVMSQVYDRLIWRDQNGEFQPALAASWEFIDPTTLELKLREGVLFHDGGEFTADDVVFTFGRLLDEANPLPLSSYVAGSIVSVDKIDDYTVRIITPAPRALLIAEIFRIAIISKDAVEAAGDSYGQNPVGTGPFRLVQWNRNESIVFEAFDDYWQGRSDIDQVVFKIIPDDFARYAALQAGEVDIISNLPPERIDEVESDPDLKVGMVHSARNMFVGMNTWEPPFDNPLVRQAMNYAVDVQLIIDTIFDGHAYLNRNICGQVTTGYDPDVATYTYDPAKALELLAEAGYSDGFEVNFWGPNGKYIKDKEVQEAMGAQLAEVGITVTHIMPEWAEYWGKYKPGELDGLMFLSTGNPLLDCDMTMVYRMYSKTAGQYFNSPELDAMIEDEQADVDPVSRKATMVEIQEYVIDQAPWIFLYDQQDPYGLSARVVWEPRSDELEWVYEMVIAE